MKLKSQIMNSNKDTANRKSADNDNSKSSQNSNLESDFDINNDSNSDNDLDINIELDLEQSEASRYNEEEYLNSKHVNKHDQTTGQSDKLRDEKDPKKDEDSGNKNRIVN